MNRLAGELTRACDDHPLEEKWLIAPTLRIGGQWLEAVALGGRPVVNARVKTIKSLALVQAFRVVTGRPPHAPWNLSGDQLKGRQNYGLDVGYLADEEEKGSGYWRSGPRPA